APAERLWHEAERQRLLNQGYPEALAEFWLLCARGGYAEKHLFQLGASTATVRKLRYLELPPWPEVAEVARALSGDGEELAALEKLWVRAEHQQRRQPRADFGRHLQQLRKQQGITRRELADLFGIGGKKPARIIKYIEEDGFYSVQAYPAGLVAVLAGDPAEQKRLHKLWQERRRQVHRPPRPETRTDPRLAPENYRLELADLP